MRPKTTVSSEFGEGHVALGVHLHSRAQVQLSYTTFAMSIAWLKSKQLNSLLGLSAQQGVEGRTLSLRLLLLLVQ